MVKILPDLTENGMLRPYYCLSDLLLYYLQLCPNLLEPGNKGVEGDVFLGPLIQKRGMKGL